MGLLGRKLCILDASSDVTNHYVLDVSNDVATFDIKSELLAAGSGDKELSLHTNYILI
jgi:hypothetical protein